MSCARLDLQRDPAAAASGATSSTTCCTTSAAMTGSGDSDSGPLDLRNVEDLVDQRKEMLAALQDSARRSPCSRPIAGRARATARSEDRIERRSENRGSSATGTLWPGSPAPPRAAQSAPASSAFLRSVDVD